MRLYTFFRSSASYRVRIALNLKGIAVEQVPVHLRRSGGEQFADTFKSINPQALVPVLEDGERVFTQSLAIIEYLEERYPDPPLLPPGAADRALVRSMALIVACEIHPIQNLRVLVYLKKNFQCSEDDINAWARHWIELGLGSLEQTVVAAPARGKFCFGDAPTLADVFLVPQLANARRFGCDLSRTPKLLKVEENCLPLPAFAAAAPDMQPDAE